jgi:hypothetical protein
MATNIICIITKSTMAMELSANLLALLREAVSIKGGRGTFMVKLIAEEALHAINRLNRLEHAPADIQEAVVAEVCMQRRSMREVFEFCLNVGKRDQSVPQLALDVVVQLKLDHPDKPLLQERLSQLQDHLQKRIAAPPVAE